MNGAVIRAVTDTPDDIETPTELDEQSSVMGDLARKRC